MTKWQQSRLDESRNASGHESRHLTVEWTKLIWTEIEIWLLQEARALGLCYEKFSKLCNKETLRTTLTWSIYFRVIKRYSGVCSGGPVYKQSKLNCRSALGQERSSQPPRQEAQFRLRPAANCRHQKKKKIQKKTENSRNVKVALSLNGQCTFGFWLLLFLKKLRASHARLSLPQMTSWLFCFNKNCWLFHQNARRSGSLRCSTIAVWYHKCSNCRLFNHNSVFIDFTTAVRL